MRKALALLLLSLVANGCGSNSPTPTAPSAVTPGRITLSLSQPELLFSGSTVTISALVRDEQGTNAKGSVVTFETSTGTLSSPTAVVDSTGYASTTLTASEQAYVTASTSNATRAVTIPAVAPFSVAVSPASAVTVNVPAAMLVSVSPNRSVVNPPSPSSVSMGCGDAPERTLSGTMTGSCTFPTAGAAQVHVSAVTANGWRASNTSDVTVLSVPTAPSTPTPAPVSPVLTAVMSCTNAASPSLNVFCNLQSVSYGGVNLSLNLVSFIEWKWGDGNTSSGYVVSHPYPQIGTYQLVLSVESPTVDGQKATTVTQLITVPKPAS